jgi:hypothetical protein
MLSITLLIQGNYPPQALSAPVGVGGPKGEAAVLHVSCTGRQACQNDSIGSKHMTKSLLAVVVRKVRLCQAMWLVARETAYGPRDALN